jgi:hypothetical protein
VFAVSLYMNHTKLHNRIEQLKYERKTKVAKERQWRVPICCDWTIEMYYVEAAFLNAELGHKQYIYVPEAMVRTEMISEKEASEICFELTKSMYGNVDAALRFFIKYKGILDELGMVQCKIDPCVFYRIGEEGFLELIIACHVDDLIIAGRKAVIEKYYDAFEKHLKIERLGKMKKHLGIWWEWKQDDNGLFLEGSMEKM